MNTTKRSTLHLRPPSLIGEGRAKPDAAETSATRRAWIVCGFAAILAILLVILGAFQYRLNSRKGPVWYSGGPHATFAISRRLT